MRFARDRICVLVAQCAEVAVLSIEDDGPGVPEASLEAVFDRFHRLVGGGDEPGAGLGLSIVRGIVEAHDGRVWAENSLQGGLGGARFTVELPLLRLQEEGATHTKEQ